MMASCRGLSENLPNVRQEEPENIPHFDTEEDITQDDNVLQVDDVLQVDNVLQIDPIVVDSVEDPAENITFELQEKIEEKYYCDVDKCDFKTKSASHLKLHKKSVHEGIKHQCDQCDRSYNFPGDLRRHKKTTHEGLRYPCAYCDFTASQTQTLKNHINKHHAYDNIIVTE